MSILSWNCRGLNNSATIQCLSDLVSLYRPLIVFLMETKVRCLRAKEILRSKGFTNSEGTDSAGRSGGLIMAWNDEVEMEVKDNNPNFIDGRVVLRSSADSWRLTGFYGFPETVRRREAWRMMEGLAEGNDGPWMMIGDFNDIMFDSEKKGNIPQPLWRLRGFRGAVNSCGLRDFPFSGYQWTWDNGKDNNYRLEQKLDRILVNDAWWDSFTGAQAVSVEAPASDHMALQVQVKHRVPNGRRRFFKFENNWIKEDACRIVVTSSWEATRQRPINERIGFCATELTRWDRGRKRGFRHQIMACKSRLAWLRGKDDRTSVRELIRVRSVLQVLLEKENQFWKQRAKEFWLKEGDINSRFFHNAVKQRRRRNKMTGLGRPDGSWLSNREELGEAVLDYFSVLFKEQERTQPLAIRGEFRQVSAEQNELLLRAISPEEVRRAVFDMHPEKAPGSDGMNPAFFQAYWEVLGPDISALCASMFETGQSRFQRLSGSGSIGEEARSRSASSNCTSYDVSTHKKHKIFR
ncbi:unnamed protein product [Cuscuta epithymum]|uniref:Endonuclease/exonuclease/phosphatase domain-containing protein n=1 Tax=Cuscuta epithymum TaxID=186058 RepID=A0AAV0D3G7_9ASTE|nr:unnamed protein product [Cuscuta epithymum]